MIYPLTPTYVSKLWGSTEFSLLKKYSKKEPLGETWEVSTHKDGSCFVGDEPLTNYCSLSYLVKLIATKKNLSIQVHPNDIYAKKNENENGKTECWFILNASPGAGIYLGFKNGVTKSDFHKAIFDKDDISKYLNFVSVQRGDFFHLPAGTIHALGKDVFLAEIQQSSGVTYRVWDWNRLGLDGKPRELHIDKAMDVLNFDGNFNREIQKKKINTLVENFSFEHNDFKVRTSHENLELTKGTYSILNLDGRINVNNNVLEPYSALYCQDEKLSLKAHSPYLIIN